MEAIIAPVPGWDVMPAAFQEMFKAFRTPDVGWNLIVDQNVFVEQVLPGAIARQLSQQEMDRYREPYLDPPSRKPLWRWPNEIPIAGEPEDVVELVSGYNAWLQETALPKLLLYASPGAILQSAQVDWCEAHMSNLRTVDLGHGIHFLQEDHPHRIGSELARWYREL